MATKFLDLDGLKYFKTKQDAANDGKYVPRASQSTAAHSIKQASRLLMIRS